MFLVIQRDDSFTWITPSSQPLMTSPLPILNLKGLLRSRDESNFVPSVNVPIYKNVIKTSIPSFIYTIKEND